jgi:hypothetical protein
MYWMLLPRCANVERHFVLGYAGRREPWAMLLHARWDRLLQLLAAIRR